jgi:4'-phosphopantetheinyl transferase
MQGGGYDGSVMTPVYWLDQCCQDVREDLDWLSLEESASLRRMRVPKRRSDWLLGRWTAKQAVVRMLRLDSTPGTLASVELLAGPDGAPVLQIGGNSAPVTVSISHREGMALCVITPAGFAVGCDLERIEAHSEAFVSDYFTPGEQGVLLESPNTDRPRLVALMWSVKESVLKLLHAGLRLDTRSVSVRVKDAFATGAQGTWHAFDALFLNGATFRGWWQSTGTIVRTVAAFPPPNVPVNVRAAEVDFAGRDILPSGKIRARHALRIAASCEEARKATGVHP